jgi:transcriptional regulator with XRE-family HTH domain
MVTKVVQCLRPDAPESQSKREMGRRLKLVREAVGLSQSGLARDIGVAPVTVSAWENGRNQIDILKLASAARRHRFSTDWVILGELSSLPEDVADRLQAIETLATETGRGRPSRPPAFRRLRTPGPNSPTGKPRRAARIVPLESER